MPLYVNIKAEFGEYGPFEAESREALADGMEWYFREWAGEKLDVALYEVAIIPDPQAAIAEWMAEMRESFIAGLEEVTE